jgi:U3 small nucleolar RNA-associated protein 20
MFEDRLPKIITVVCGSLKNKESNERDIAKDTLSKMAVSLDLKYLPLILTELSVSLNEGYKLHVRSAALHSILVALSKVYQHQPVQNDDEVASLPFERCVPAMLDIIHQDVFGKASEIKEVEHAQKRLIKEAMGSKSYDSLEIIARKIYFKPSIISVSVQETLPGLSHASAVHALVTPLLERLREPDVSPSTIRKVKECLQRVTVGLSTNPGANYDELLPFVFATVSPFVCGWWNHSADEDVLDNDDEEEAPIQVSRSTSTNDSTNLKSQKDNKTRPSSVAVATWNPSSLGSAESQRSAFEAKKKYKRTLYKINDGVSAPKLTGSSRHSSLISLTSNTLNMPANACAVNFGLTLLNSCLKRSKIDVTNELQCSLADPFLPLLAHCTRYSSDSQAIVLSLKSLCFLLRMNLPSVSRTAKELGPGILQHLTSSCAASNTAQNEIVQGCFKTLALLISHPKFSLTTEHDDLTNTTGDSTRQFVHNDALPLKADQMQCLLSLLHGAVRESEQQNATFGLVKAIAAKRYMSPEFFDLMDIILKLSVQSQKHAVRLQCSQIFLNYLLEYPMGNKRMENHLHQIVLNIKYEYEEGRLSAIDLLSSLIQKFPVPFLEGQAHLFFLPLVLSLVKDESSKCKEAVASCILSMLTRLSADTVQSLYGYVKRWSQSAGPESIPMQLASAQLFGIFVEARPDYVKRGKNFSDLAGLITRVISQHSSADDGEWELIYHYLVCMEKLNKFVPGSMASNLDVWRSLVNLLAYPHPWIMQVSARIISGHLNAIDYKELARNDCDSFITKVPGCLYDIARNSCRQIDVEDRLYVDATSTIAIKTITSVFKIMKLRPDLCYTEQNNDNENEEMIPKGQAKDPCLWLMTRLSNIAKPRGRRRRESVFKCFASLCTSCSPDSLNQYLQLIIDPLDRAVREASIKIRPGDLQGNDPHTSLPKEVLQILEDTCGDNFFKAYAEVNRNARQKREKRKQDIAAEAIHDPIAAAQRKINKQRKEKERKKRRIDEQRSSRGALKKNRHN